MRSGTTSGTDLPQRLQEPVAVDTRGTDDLIERPLCQIASVHRDHDPMRQVGMAENVVTALDSIELPAATFQRADRLPRRDGR